MVNGHPIFYPLVVIGIFVIYIAAFYFVYHLIQAKCAKAVQTQEVATEEAPVEDILSV
jgi:hypothetical protein